MSVKTVTKMGVKVTRFTHIHNYHVCIFGSSPQEKRVLASEINNLLVTQNRYYYIILSKHLTSLQILGVNMYDTSSHRLHRML